uniref:Kielin/chordin-like protein n=1 Tax=Crassostrea virginica TaxID=6565 RepID=A0A8B8C655_CRAVI|nr:kielin/chordin-like protein [Crassostrea virginica]
MRTLVLVLLCVFSVLGTYAPKRPRPPVKQKPGVCPRSDIITTCDCRPENIKCRGDQDCPGVQKCCSFGCGCRTRCVNPAGQPPTGCRYNGKTYKIGLEFRARDGCNRCRCGRNGRVNCTRGRCLRVCRYSRKVYRVGQTFRARDGCNKCRCGAGGRVSCSKRRCGKNRVKGRYVCSQPKVVGPCEARIPRWWFNKKANCCLRFYYGGCKGNGNNFKTKTTCLRRCKTRSYVK